MFPVGTTEVDCMASDAAGLVGEAHFSVSISQTLAGRMHGAGTVGSGQQRVSFAFDVGESANWRRARVADGAGEGWRGTPAVFCRQG